MANNSIDRVEFGENEARFYGDLRPHVHRQFLRFVRDTIKKKPKNVLLDFSNCTNAFPNTMLPIIADVYNLKENRIATNVSLPRDDVLKRRFYRTNWASFLEPTVFQPTDEISDKHLAVVQYRGADEQHKVVNDLLDITLRTLQLNRSHISALEWSLNEITDNVLQHAKSPVGGFVQLAAMHSQLAFCVVDIGRGIRDSLSEAYPNLGSDIKAIEQAVRVGVTRNKDIGQGNGLSGSLNIAIETKGTFHILSGFGDIRWTEKNNITNKTTPAPFHGTLVDVQIRIDQQIDLAAVLSKGTNVPAYKPTDFIETQYSTCNDQIINVNLKDDTFGFGTRRAGEQMRNKCINLMRSEPNYVLKLNWDGVQLISSSYADEFIAKLYWEIGPTAFSSHVKHENMNHIISSLIDKAILQRVHQMISR